MSDKHIMVVEDDPELIRILQAVLKKLDVEMRVAGTGRKALQMLHEGIPAVLLLDMRLPDMMGSEVLAYVRERALPVTVIVMTAHGSVDIAVEAMRNGAYDFLTKPLDFERVRIMVRNALERHELIEQLEDFRSEYERARFHKLRGSAPVMQRLYKQITKTAAGTSPVAILGEEGTEVDLVAESLHAEGSRSEAPYIEVDLAALPVEEQELEIFGTAGSARGISKANGGTLHIHAIDKATPEVQQALFDYLQDGEIVPRAGEPKEIDARIVVSSHADLKKAMENHQFDEDLYYALTVTTLRLAPLRDRGEDILDIAEAALRTGAKAAGKQFEAFDDDAVGALFNYDWPGNYTELKEAIAHIVARGDDRVVKVSMLPESVAKAAARATDSSPAALRGLEATATVKPLWQVEKEAIEKALKLCDDNVIHAARVLEITPATIYRKQRSWRARSS